MYCYNNSQWSHCSWLSSVLTVVNCCEFTANFCKVGTLLIVTASVSAVWGNTHSCQVCVINARWNFTFQIPQSTTVLKFNVKRFCHYCGNPLLRHCWGERLQLNWQWINTALHCLGMKAMINVRRNLQLRQHFRSEKDNFHIFNNALSHFQMIAILMIK